MTIKKRWMICALAMTLGGCARPFDRPGPLPVVAEERECPAFPVPPEELMEPPRPTKPI